MASKNRITINLSASEQRELQALAERARVSVAWIGRQAVTEFLERHRNDELQLPLGLSRPPSGDHLA